MAAAWTPDLQSYRALEERNWRHRACWRKVEFRSQSLAERVARRHSRHSGELINAYLCPLDGSHWHIGHVLKRKEASDGKATKVQAA